MLAGEELVGGGGGGRGEGGGWDGSRLTPSAP